MLHIAEGVPPDPKIKPVEKVPVQTHAALGLPEPDPELQAKFEQFIEDRLNEQADIEHFAKYGWVTLRYPKSMCFMQYKE